MKKMCQSYNLDVVTVHYGCHAGWFLVAFDLDGHIEFDLDVPFAEVLDFGHPGLGPDAAIDRHGRGHSHLVEAIVDYKLASAYGEDVKHHAPDHGDRQVPVGNRPAKRGFSDRPLDIH